MPSTRPTLTPAIRTADLSSSPATSRERDLRRRRRAPSRADGRSSIFRTRTASASRTARVKSADLGGRCSCRRLLGDPGLRVLAPVAPDEGASRGGRPTPRTPAAEGRRGSFPPSRRATRSATSKATLQVVRDRHHRRVHPVPQVDHDAGEDVRRDRVEAGRRLVEEEDLGLQRDGPGEADAPAHAAGELRRALPLDAGQPHEREALGDARRHLVRVILVCRLSAKAMFSPTRHRVEERPLLERHPEAAADLVAPRAGGGPEVLPLDLAPSPRRARGARSCA